MRTRSDLAYRVEGRFALETPLEAPASWRNVHVLFTYHE